MAELFDTLKIGSVLAPNRVFMAPMTRARATRDHVPTPIMATYYAQRASAGLIISEGIGINQEGLGWPYAPGIWKNRQVEAWRPITEAVHDAGGRIFAQLWHMGRNVHPDFINGKQPISASPTTAPDEVWTYEGKKPSVQARMLPLEEVPRLLDDYHQAALNAMAAGFDGVQLHAANGYLIDQFLRSSQNQRSDKYGGSVENRIRLLEEVIHALVDAAGEGRTAIRLSPNDTVQGIGDCDPVPLFKEASKALSRFNIAFLEIREPRPNGTFGAPDHPPIAPTIRKSFPGPLILNSDYYASSARVAISTGEADAISFGRPFLANPDLPQRIERNFPLNEGDVNTWYSQGTEGYIDYPTFREQQE